MVWYFLNNNLENSLCSQEQAEACLQGNCSDGNVFALLKLIPTQERSCSLDSETEALSASLFGMTLKPFKGNHGKEKSMLSAEDSLVPTSAPPTPRKKDLKAKRAASGKKCLESFAKWSPNGSLWKTSQASLFGESTEYSGTWPKWGTMRDGECWEAMKSESQCKGNECGLWRPATSVDSCGRGYHGKLSGKHWLALPGQICKYLGLPIQCPQTGLIMPWVYEELMGWPIGWSGLLPLGTDKLLNWQQLHSPFYQDCMKKESNE